MSNTRSNRRLTTTQFIERARKVHGEYYDYSLVNYQTMRTKVTIICPDHGPFEQLPVEHLHGSGCPRCAQSNRAKKRRMSQDEFLARCHEVHGDTYDYSRARYVNKNTKVEIICPEHGSFWQSPSNHWKGQGCPKCAGRMRANGQAGFIQRAKEIHGNKYDYSKVVYRGTRVPVTIICSKHGEFQCTPERHLEGRGCPLCHPRKAPVLTPETEAKRVAAIKQTCLERYGATCYLQSDEGREKTRKTSQKRYGADSFMASAERQRREPEIHAKRQAAWMQSLGVDSPSRSDIVRERVVETMREHYGHDSFFGSDTHRAHIAEFNERSQATCMEHYGVPYYSQSAEWKQRARAIMRKVTAAKCEHGTFNTSEPEDALYELLCDMFGADDVKRQYNVDVRYPYHCDFYIPSRDLFIELNAAWTHNGHWFDANDTDDIECLNEWQQKAAESKFYAASIDTWTRADLEKRACAEQHQLNYLTFWDTHLRDALVWMGFGCPDGRDYERIWSWFDVPEELTLEMLTTVTSARSISQVVRAAQQDVFYAEEKAFWADTRRGVFDKCHHLPARMKLYANRCQYADKPITELDAAALLRGFKISGMVRGYSVFNTKLMRAVIERYGIASIADPCAGWGERLLTCAQLGVAYEGVDVNDKLEPGYQRMIDAFGTGQQTFAVDAGETHVFRHADAVITCPPYLDHELYSEHGAENLEPVAFARWWAQVVENCTKTAQPKLFCVQTNQKCRTLFKQGLEQNGYTLIDELQLESQSSHFTRMSGGVNVKREFESMIVFAR